MRESCCCVESSAGRRAFYCAALRRSSRESATRLVILPSPAFAPHHTHQPHAHSSTIKSTRNVPPNPIPPTDPLLRTQPRPNRPPTPPAHRRLLPRNSALQRILRERAYGPDPAPANFSATTCVPRPPNDPCFVAAHSVVVAASHASIPDPGPAAYA